MKEAFALFMAAFPAVLIIYLSIKLAITRFKESKERKRDQLGFEKDVHNFNVNLTD